MTTRAIVVALGTGAFITSAAALSIGGNAAPAFENTSSEAYRTGQSARALQRARIEARYQDERARCQGQSGMAREKCLVKAHATRGRALLQAAAPYEVRS